MNKSELFYCYSPKLKQYLCGKGIKFLHKGTNDNTNKWFWVFMKSDELNNVLTEWSLNK